MALVYMSPDPYHEAFEETIDLRCFDLSQHRAVGLCLAHSNGCLFLGSMTPGTPAAKIPRWHSRLKGAWLIKIRHHTVTSIAQAHKAFAQLIADGTSNITLLFSHPNI